MLITGIAVILFSTAGIARMMGWGANSTADSGDILERDQSATALATGKARARSRCPECGVIVSVREIERHDDDTGSYEFTVRMADGSKRVIDDVNPARWRPGERLIVIDGAHPSSR